MVSKKEPLYVIENRIIKGRKSFLPEGACLNEVILRNLKEKPEFVGQIDSQTGRTCTYGKLADDSIRCALWLKKQGIGPGDIVSICTHNNIGLWSPFCATLFVGANLNPWFNDWPPEMMKHYIHFIRPKVIFANETAGSMLEKITREEDLDTKIIVLGQVAGLDSIEDIIRQQSPDEVAKFLCTPVNPNENAMILFTSGTSGFSKGVQHSYQGMYNNTYRFHNSIEETNEMILMLCTPIYWMSGTLCVLRSLLTSCPTVIVNDPILEEFLRVIKKFKVQWIFVGTAIVNELCKYDMLTDSALSSVRFISTGGSKVRPENTKKINSVLKNGEILQLYGLTEVGGVASMQQKGHTNHGSCGIVANNVEIKILDVCTGETLEAHKQGEILIKQPNLMKYYHKNPRATQETIDSEGWLHTGDIGYYDGDGHIYIMDRIKELIIYRGHHISPVEIENILLKHPKVMQAAVAPVPHSVDDERPMAFVIKVKNAAVSKDELLDLLSILGDTKKLRGGLEFVDKLPLTPAGKLNRSKLKEMAKAYAS